MAEWLYAWGIKMIKRNLNKENTTNLYEVTVTNTVKLSPDFDEYDLIQGLHYLKHF